MNTTQRTKLTEGPITPILIRLSIPMLIGILGIVAFNLVDAFFVGQIGALELAALSFTFPVVMILGCIGMGIGVGASAIISRAIGERNKEKSQRLTTDSITLAVLASVVFIIVGLLSMDPLFRLLGADEEVLPFIREYMNIWYLGVVFVMATFIGNNAMRANGDTKTPAAIMICMVILNTLLDPLLIFGWGPIPALGMEGAALATVIARALSFVFGLYFLHFRDHLLSLRRPAISEVLQSWKNILRIGLPAAATNLVVPLTVALITRLVASYGPTAVAALGVASRIDIFAITAIVALANVLGPFIGQNIGGKHWDRVRKGIYQSQLFAVIWGFCMLIFMLIGAPWIAPFFNEDPHVISAIVLYLSIAPFGYCARGLYAIGTMTLNVLNKPLKASAITIIQMFGIYLPLAYLGAYLFGLAGVFGAMALAYFVGGGLSYFMVKQELNRQDKQNEVQEKSDLVVA